MSALPQSEGYVAQPGRPWYPDQTPITDVHRHWCIQDGIPLHQVTPKVISKLKESAEALLVPSLDPMNEWWHNDRKFTTAISLLLTFCGVEDHTKLVGDGNGDGERFQVDPTVLHSITGVMWPSWSVWLGRIRSDLGVGGLSAVPHEQRIWEQGCKAALLYGARIKPIPNQRGYTRWDLWLVFLHENPEWLKLLDDLALELARS